MSGKYGCKRNTIDNLFENAVWKNISTESGHKVFQNIFTKVVVNYSNHKDPVDPAAVITIADKIQDHINILGNEIFCFTTENWKEAPDFIKSAKRVIDAMTKLKKT
jgi:hypothetical protein